MIRLKEPEYSDDEDFEGVTEDDDGELHRRHSKNNRKYDNVGGGVGFEPKAYSDSNSPKGKLAGNHMSMPPIDISHNHAVGKNNVNGKVGGLPQIR
jgi:hypothetical protein